MSSTFPGNPCLRSPDSIRNPGPGDPGEPEGRCQIAYRLGYGGIKRIRKPKASSLARLLKETGSRINLVANLRSIDDFEVLYTDFTEILYRRGRAKAQLMPIVDHSSKLVVGYALGEADNTELALAAWRRAKKALKRYGVKTEGIIVHHDQDGVYLGHGWLYELAIRDKVRVSYSENGAKGNVHMESFNGRLKSENRCECQVLFQASVPLRAPPRRRMLKAPSFSWRKWWMSFLR
jgi:transposase InsO family protein